MASAGEGESMKLIEVDMEVHCVVAGYRPRGWRAGGMLQAPPWGKSVDDPA
jgi:hypothetical protein